MQICWTLTWDSWKGWHWGRFETIPVTTVNSTLAVHAITLLALCYLPGCIGAWIQIFRGTKYSRFPNWLDKWLKMRKQLGLLMLFSASLHVSTYFYSDFWKESLDILRRPQRFENILSHFFDKRRDSSRQVGDFFKICLLTTH